MAYARKVLIHEICLSHQFQPCTWNWCQHNQFDVPTQCLQHRGKIHLWQIRGAGRLYWKMNCWTWLQGRKPASFSPLARLSGFWHLPPPKAIKELCWDYLGSQQVPSWDYMTFLLQEGEKWSLEIGHQSQAWNEGVMWRAAYDIAFDESEIGGVEE